MTQSGSPVPAPGGRSLLRAAQVIVVSSVMFTFISYWRTAAVVLCDLASTAYYIGGIVELSIGPAAPWFILAVMLFSYAVRSVYIESCALFVRGGVYRVVKEAMGGFFGKISVSALMFDYILTGPISAVSAGQYISDLVVRLYFYFNPAAIAQMADSLDSLKLYKNWASVLIAVVVTVYFFRQNVRGIHESSDKALKIMIATTIMAVVLLLWCGLTLLVQGAQNAVPFQPDFRPHENPNTGKPEDPLGFLAGSGVADVLQSPDGVNWLGLIGLMGFAIAFGHSILAMSGEETLAQVYREVESPKLKNFKKAAFIVFVYSLVVTAGISFLAVLLIPDKERMPEYSDNLIGGLAMNVIGPTWARLILNAFVVIVGFLILSGAVNTAIIGSNGVLNRVAEDGVMPEWFLKPHPRFGTTYRMLFVILSLQLFIIFASRGDVLLLGEAYAFGVVWSFVFISLAMLILRFKQPLGREYKVPLNLRVGSVEIPIGLGLVFLVLLICAIMNLLTKPTATIFGVIFTTGFLVIFSLTQYFHERRRRGGGHEHLEQFNQKIATEVSSANLGLSRPFHKLVAIRSPHNLFMLEQALSETDPATTDIVVMTAKVSVPGETPASDVELDTYDQELMTAVVKRAEKTGKQVIPLIVPTNNPLHAVLRTAKELGVQEVILGASNKFTAEEQLDQIAFYWINLHDGQPRPLTVRILSRNRDVYYDLAGGNRIPRVSERQARSVAELRAAGVGVKRVLLAHDGSRAGNHVFQAVLTMLDPGVPLDLVLTTPADADGSDGPAALRQAQELAKHLGRELGMQRIDGDQGAGIVRLARELKYDLIILPLPEERPSQGKQWWGDWANFVLAHSSCQVAFIAQPVIPKQVEE